MRKTSIDVLGDAAWGTHVCLFYEAGDDLTEVLVPYFKTGLQHNELCIWIALAPLETQKAREALRAAVPGFDDYLRGGRIEIIPHDQWYLEDGVFDRRRVIERWIDKFDFALKHGYAGLRVGATAAWCSNNEIAALAAYEDEMDELMAGNEVIAICTYDLSRLGADEVIEAVGNHQHALVKRQGRWQLIENTERKRQAAEALRQSEERFRLITEHMRDAVFLANPSGTTTYISPSFTHLLGYTLEEAASLKMEDLLTPSSLELAYPRLSAVAATGYREQEHSPRKAWPELQFRCKDGSIIWAELGISLLWDSRGKLAGITGIIHDTTGRKRSEESLRESERRYRSLYAAMMEGMAIHEIVYDESGNPADLVIVDANPAYESILGFKKEEVLGKMASEVYRQDWQRYLDIIAGVARTGQPVSFEAQYEAIDKHFSISAFSPTEDKLALLFTDITSRKRSENRSLRQSRVLHAINRLLLETVCGRTMEEISRTCLDVCQELSGSRFGWIGVITKNNRLNTVAMSDLGWSACRIPETETPRLAEQREIKGIWGTVLRTGRSAIINDPSSHPNRAGLPEGHPPLACYLGVPLKDGPRTIGMISLANKEGGYSAADQEDIEALSAAFVQALKRNETEEKLSESESRFRGVFDSTNVGIAIVDLDGRVMEMNEAGSHFLGYSRDELIGTPFSRCTHPEDLPTDQALYASVVNGERDSYAIDQRYITKQGKTAWGRLSLSIVRDEGGQPQYSVIVCEDITEQKQAEEALRIKEEYFRTLIENSSDAVAVLDATGRIMYDGPSAERVLGHLPNGIVGRYMLDFVHPEDRGRAEPLFRRLLEEPGHAVSADLRSLRGDGTWCVLECSARNLLYQPHVRGIVVNYRDITDRKRAEEALIESEARLKEAHQMAGMGRWDFRHTDRHLAWTDTIYDIFEMDRLHSPGPFDGFLAAVHPEDHRMVYQAWMDSLATQQPYEIEHRLLMPDGRIKWVSQRCRTESDQQGNPLLSVGIVQDITERKQAETLIQCRLVLLDYAASHSLQELLRKTLDEVEALTGSTTGFYHSVDGDQKSLSLQAWSTRTLSICEAQFQASHYPIDQAGVWADCVRERRPVVHNDYASLPHRKGTPGGHAHILRELVVPIMRSRRVIAILGVGNKPSDYTDKDVEVVSYLADVAWEIAERKQAEDKLHVAYEEEKELRRYLEVEAKKRLEFSRALVHELKTPLTAVIATSDLFISELKDEPWASMAANIHRGAQGLSKRIDELLDLAKGEIGMLKVNLRPVSPLELLKEIVSEMAPAAAARKLTLATDLPETLPEVQADSVRLRQVIYNLVNNACKFTDEGGRITVEARQEQDSLVVEIHDTGVGLAPEEQEKLFRPYERLKADRQRFSGLGLGLALSKNLVELHGGRIWVNSKKGQGSTFGFSIPIDGHGDKPGEDNSHGPLGP